MYGKELMGIKSDKVYRRTCSRSAETSGGIAFICKRLGKMMSKEKLFIEKQSLVLLQTLLLFLASPSLCL